MRVQQDVANIMNMYELVEGEETLIIKNRINREGL